MSGGSTPGGYANAAGGTLESMVTTVLQGKGFAVVPWRQYLKSPGQYGDELLLRNVPYQTIYGHPGKTEFVLRSARFHLNIRIECKWQQSAGSVDEKFPYLYLNCVEAMPEPTVFILVDGGGAKAGAVRWLQDAATSRRYTPFGTHKDIQVMDLTTFVAWAHRTFR